MKSILLLFLYCYNIVNISPEYLTLLKFINLDYWANAFFSVKYGYFDFVC